MLLRIVAMMMKTELSTRIIKEKEKEREIEEISLQSVLIARRR